MSNSGQSPLFWTEDSSNGITTHSGGRPLEKVVRGGCTAGEKPSRAAACKCNALYA